ncbi:Mitochondrial protein Pet127 [Lasallia pustulata]|uniref:Mitochondrial protein Pet127 n=1 Tax=Lasallia pustulata TaxID=136370 RepID=A0A1W5CY55_9LECA|nr:Mitochondrial protein Pet127 [Lasallia pustulata]
MKSYSIRGAIKPNHNYVCPSCLLSRPFAPRRQTLRFKSTDAIGVYPTPDQSVAALLWSREEAIAKTAKKSGEAIAKPTKRAAAAKRKAGQKEQTEQIERNNVVATKPAVVAKRKATKKGKAKVSKASDRQRTTAKAQTPAVEDEAISTAKAQTPAWKDGPISAVPISSILASFLDKEHPVHKTPTSLTKNLQKKFALAKAASLHERTQAVKSRHPGQTPKHDGEQNADRDHTAISGQADNESAVKAAERSEKTSSGMIKDLTAKESKSPTGKAKASKAKAAKSPLIKRLPSRIINKYPSRSVTIRKLKTDGGGVDPQVRKGWDVNDVIKKTEAALERRTQEIRREVKTERLSRARGRAQEALAGRESRTKSAKFSKDGTKSIKKSSQQESDADVQAPVGTDIQTVNAADLDIAPIPVQQAPVPGLSYGLERVLFNPGVYHLQDPRSRVFNFDPYLKTIMPVSEFDFNALKEYITSSRDESLKELAQSHGKRYVGSSSSMTSALVHFHFLLSQWREINANMLSRGFQDKLRSFTKLQRAPSAIFLRWKDGTYAIDADKEFDSANILMMLGKSMEKLLTLSTGDFERYRVSNSDKISNEERNEPESYHYSTIGDFLMRSQLDAHDPRLPGSGMFDLKTRAVVSVRMDAKNYEEGVGYQIRTRQGDFESFEREYFDMIRAAFLKYSLQVRMGRMDGIFVAFHNTERIFGFQYISLPEMDTTLHGQYDTSIGDQEFKLSLELLNKVLDKATKRYPEQSLRLHFETRDTQTPFMYIFAEPVTEEQVHELQTKNKEKIADFERNILGLNKNYADDTSLKDDDKWADIRANVEEAMTKDEESLGASGDQESSLATTEYASDNQEGETTLQSFATVNRGPLYESKGPLEADPITAAATADGVDVEDEDEDDGVEVDESGDEDELADEASTTTEPESSELDSVAEVEYSTKASEDSEGAAEGVDAASPDHDTPDPNTPLQEAEADGEAEADAVADADREADADGEADAESESESKAEAEAEDSQTPGDRDFLDAITSSQPPTPPPEILALNLTIRNKVNGKYVLRPTSLDPADAWSVEYSIIEVAPQTRAWSLYQACQLRRKKHLDADEEGDEAKADYYLRRIQELSRKGREWRVEQDRLDEGRPVFVVGEMGARGTAERGEGEEGK